MFKNVRFDQKLPNFTEHTMRAPRHLKALKMFNYYHKLKYQVFSNLAGPFKDPCAVLNKWEFAQNSTKIIGMLGSFSDTRKALIHQEVSITP